MHSDPDNLIVQDTPTPTDQSAGKPSAGAGEVSFDPALGPASDLTSDAPPPATAVQGQLSARPDKVSPFQPGDIVGGSYQIIDLLGCGGMGMVYTAKHVNMPAHYALKVLLTADVTDTKFLRFQNEAQAIAKLNHPNIIAIYNFGQHEGRAPFYVMELLVGENLLHKLNRDGPAPVAIALPIFIEVCGGLGHAHKKGILHRDVKPANIVILNEPDPVGARVKIVDFGIVKFSEEVKPDAQKLTALGAVCGSPSYMSPEQAAGEKIDPRSDIYSLGCSLFQTLTGKVPFHGRNATETMLMHHDVPVPTLASKGDGRTYSPALEELVGRMLAKEPMDRYQTMDQVAQDMVNITKGLALGTPQAIPSRGGATRHNMDAMAPPPVAPTRAARSTKYDINVIERNQQAGGIERRPQETTHALTFKPGVRVVSKSEEEENTGTGFTGEMTSTSETLRRHKIGLRLAKFSLIWIISLALFGSAFFMAWQGFDALKASRAKPVLELNQFTDEGARAPDETNKAPVHEAIMKDPADLEESGPVELPKARYFSKSIVVNGCPYLQFDFPKQTKGAGLAWIGTGIQDSAWTVGKLLFAKRKDTPIFLLPAPGVINIPQFFDKFRPGDIQGLAFAPRSATDGLFICTVERMPWVPSLRIQGCDRLTRNIVPSLSKMHLTELAAAGVLIDGEDLAEAPIWQNLIKLNLKKCNNVGPILKKLAGSKKLEDLDLGETKLSSADFQLIAKISSLKSLNLTSVQYTEADIHALSKLPKLEELGLVYTRLKSENVIAEVKQFQSLKSLVVIRGFIKMPDQLMLRQERPRLMIREVSSDQLNTEQRMKRMSQW